MLLDDLLPAFDATRIEHPVVGVVLRSLLALVARTEPAEAHNEPTPLEV